MSLLFLYVFVVGVDTGVGKTIVCVRVVVEVRVRGLVPGMLKAVQMGADDDAMWVVFRVFGTVATTIYRYESGLAPALAARVDGEAPVEIATIVEAVAEPRLPCNGVIAKRSNKLLKPLITH